MLLRFKGDFLLGEISLLYVKTKIEPYVRRPMQCFNCYTHNLDEVQYILNIPRCANCKEPHKSIDSRCIFEKNKLLCKKMSYENFSQKSDPKFLLNFEH